MSKSRAGSREKAYFPPSQIFAWDKDRLAVVSETQRLSYVRPAMSPSTMKAMDGCPARWAGEKAMPEADDPFGAADLGTSAHAVLEDFYDVTSTPPEDRTQERAMAILLSHSKQRWPGQDEATYAKRGLWISAVHDAYRGLFDIEDPKAVSVYELEMAFGTPGGIQVEVNGTPFIGFIDRVEHTPNGLRIVDYKSGAKMPVLKWGDGDGDQVRLYREVIRAHTGKEPQEAALHYIRLGKTRDVDLKPAKMRQVLNKFKAAWDDLNGYIESGSFPTKESPLCGWCPLVAACPTAAAAGREPRREGLPTKTDLGIPVVRTLEASDLHAISDERAKTAQPASWDFDFGSAFNGDMSTPDPNPPVPSLADVFGDDTGAAHLSSTQPTTASHTEEHPMSEILLSEDKSWEETSSNLLNANSFAAQAVFGISQLAYREIVKAGIAPSATSVDALGQTFAYLVANVQRQLSGVAGWQDGANSRVRGTLRTYLSENPLPWGYDGATWDAWVAKASKHMLAMSRAALRLYNDASPQSPWLALASAPAPTALPNAS